ncbi:MAG: thiamine-phosphate kinase [Candidatus Bathyarchaeia archaeon]
MSVGASFEMDSELGERRIIEIILESLDVMPSMPIPFGDDASAVEIDRERLVVIKADMLVGKTDVPPGMSLRQAARKAVVMNISDLAAKGVEPVAVLSSIGLPRGLKKEEVREIGLGLNEGAREYGAYIIGGDTNEAQDLVISCSVLGFCEKNAFMKRIGAHPGDIVAVTGPFGRPAAGLKILLENLSAPVTIRDSLVEAVLMPRARLKEGLALASSGTVTSSIDSSDGLAWSLYELSRASSVGFLIEDVPVPPEVERFAENHNLNPLELGLYGGEEYELVVTVKPELWDKAEEAVEKLDALLIEIGRVIEEKKILLETSEGVKSIEARGWEHFKT